MSQATAEDIVSSMRDHADEYLRSVVHYTKEGHEILYLRDDVAEQYTDEGIEAVIEELRWEGFERPYQEGLYVHGDLQCTLRVFEQAVELHFPHGEMAGTAVALDPGAAGELHAFVTESVELVEGG